MEAAVVQLVGVVAGFLLGLMSQRHFSRAERRRVLKEQRLMALVDFVDDMVAAAYASNAMVAQIGELQGRMLSIVEAVNAGSRQSDVAEDVEFIQEQRRTLMAQLVAEAMRLTGPDAAKLEWKGRMRQLHYDPNIDAKLEELGQVLLKGGHFLSKDDISHATKIAQEIRGRVEELVCEV